MNKVNFGVDVNDRNRSIIYAPVDIAYMKKQRDTLNNIILTNHNSMAASERQEMDHLIGMLDHIIHNIFFIVAEYHTANRTTY